MTFDTLTAGSSFQWDGDTPFGRVREIVYLGRGETGLPLFVEAGESSLLWSARLEQGAVEAFGRDRDPVSGPNAQEFDRGVPGRNSRRNARRNRGKASPLNVRMADLKATPAPVLRALRECIELYATLHSECEIPEGSTSELAREYAEILWLEPLELRVRTALKGAR